jgi:tetratricopeptide (TPR) repeat protein
MRQPLLPQRTWPSRLPIRAARLVAVILVVGVTTAGCAGKTAAQRASDELNAGLAASAQGRNGDAATYYTNCVQLDPTNKFCIFNLGVIAQNDGRTAEAENDYRLALFIDPQFSAPLYNLALIRAAVGSPTEAIDLYKRFLQVQPDVAEAHLRLSLLLRQTGDNAAADRELAEAVRLNPALASPTASP